jgi:hypothetical protein
MNALTLLSRAWRKYRGKGASLTPAWGSEKADLVIAIANEQQETWANDTNQSWTSLFRATPPVEPGTVATTGTTALTGTGTNFTDYEPGDKILVDGETVRTIDAITSDTALTVTVAFSNTASGKTFHRTAIIKAGLQEYTLHRSFIKPSDEVVVSTATQEIGFATKKPEDRANGDVYFSGKDPKKVTFYSEIVATSQAVGGELVVAGYYMPDSLVNETDNVSVDDPNWLATIVAAELCRNDASKDDQFANLIGVANDLYLNMVDSNDDIGFKQGGTVPYNMPQIGGYAEDGAFDD